VCLLAIAAVDRARELLFAIPTLTTAYSTNHASTRKPLENNGLAAATGGENAIDRTTAVRAARFLRSDVQKNTRTI